MKQMTDGRSRNNNLAMIKVSYKSRRHKLDSDFLWTHKDEEGRDVLAMLELEWRWSGRVFC